MEDFKQKNNLRLSIIIPVYNAVSYLERCVKSCLSQDFSHNEYEILLCNDGSTDKSLELASKLSSEHDCIKVFSQENAGAGMARNLGLKNAIGKYVIFVDSDDYLAPNSLKPLLKKCEELNLDLCKYVIECIFLDSGQHKLRLSPIETNVVFGGDELLRRPEVPLDSACSSFYKREFLVTNNLYFSGQTSSEDVAFNMRVYPNAKRVMYSNNHVYTYEVRTGSRRHSTDLDSRKRYLFNNIRNAGHVMKAANDNTLLSDETCKSLKKRSRSMTIGALIELQNAKNVFPREIAEEALDFAHEQGLYPIKGCSFSWKTTLLAHMMLNNKKLFLSRFKK